MDRGIWQSTVHRAAESGTRLKWLSTHLKSLSIEKTLMLGKIEGRRRRQQQRMRWLDAITDTMDMGFGGLPELVMDREVWPTAVHGVAKSRIRLRLN